MRYVSVLTIANLKLELNKSTYINHDREEMAQRERYYAKGVLPVDETTANFCSPWPKICQGRTKQIFWSCRSFCGQRFVIKNERLTSHLLTMLLKLWALSVVVGEQINQRATGLLLRVLTSTRSSLHSLILICKLDCLFVYWNRVVASAKWPPPDTVTIQGLSFSLFFLFWGRIREAKWGQSNPGQIIHFFQNSNLWHFSR